MVSFNRAHLHTLIEQLIEVAYPRRCAGCGLRGRWVCDECLESVPLFADPRCPICSIPLDGPDCDCRDLPDGIDRFWAAGPYDGWLRAAVHDFKFRGETARAASLAMLIAAGCRSMGDEATLVPVPIHPKRRRQRGYDQVAILTHEVAKQSGHPVVEALWKVRETPMQVGLSASERSLNLMNAFAVRPEIDLADRVVLIDDVATTGSTLAECARALRLGGASTVSAVVIAHGL